MGLVDFAKGIGEAVGDVGEAIGGDFVVDKIQQAPGAARNVARTASAVGGGLVDLAANPTKVARGAGAAIQFVEDNPGQVWDTGFEVGRAIVKDQLDPVNLAITAGLVGLTVATGGAAAPALAAKLATGARTAVTATRAGATALRAGESALGAIKASTTAARVLRAADKAGDVARTVERIDDAGDALRTVDRVGDAGRSLDRMDSFLSGTRYATGEKKLLTRVLHPLEDVVQARRNQLGTRILNAAEDGADSSAWRQAGAMLAQGNTGAKPIQLAGQSAGIAKFNTAMWRGRAIAGKTVGLNAKVAAGHSAYQLASNPADWAANKAREIDPEQALQVANSVAQNPDVQEAALDHMNGQFYDRSSGMGGGGGEEPPKRYGGGEEEPEEPDESLNFGAAAPQVPPQAMQSPTFGPPTVQGQPNTPNPVPGAPATPGGAPIYSTLSYSTMYANPTTTNVAGRGKRKTGQRSRSRGFLNPQDWGAAWQQPSHEGLGGIGMGYDWRQFIPAKITASPWVRKGSDRENQGPLTTTVTSTATIRGGGPKTPPPLAAAAVPATPTTPSLSQMYAAASPQQQQQQTTPLPQVPLTPLRQPPAKKMPVRV